MRTKPEEIEELIRRQPRLTSERFWQQLERARALSPSVESLKTVPLEEEAPLKKIPPLD
jgi:hypothetical protein